MAGSETPEALLQRTLAFIADHRASYLSSGGEEGHLIDMSHVGVRCCSAPSGGGAAIG